MKYIYYYYNTRYHDALVAVEVHVDVADVVVESCASGVDERLDRDLAQAEVHAVADLPQKHFTV